MANRATAAQAAVPTSKVDVPYPDWRQLVNGVLKMNAEVQFGSFTADGNAREVTLEFDPAFVLVWNQSDPGIGFALPSFTAAHMALLVDGTVALTHETTNGITLGVKKFTIGANANLNGNTDVVHWMAIGSRGVVGS